MRGDYVDDEQDDQMVRREIAIFNDIVANCSPSRVNCKFSPRWEALYTVSSSRFFRMPFCASRGVNELRCVFRMSKDEEMVHVSDEVVAKLQAYVTTNEESDYDLFCAAMLMRLDIGNYITTERIQDSHDINLFSINRNDATDQGEYFAQWKTGSIVSFFSCGLAREEFALHPEEVLNFDQFSIIDSRPFINRKIFGLYLIIDKRMDMSFMMSFSVVRLLSLK